MSRTQRPFAGSGLVTPESLQAGTEFTDRDPQWPATREYQNDAGEARAAADMPVTPLGEPAIDVDVRSVYDVRPIQAFDVNLTVESATPLVNNTCEGTTLVTSVLDSVPLGYVFVLRKVTPYFFGSTPPIQFRNDALITLLKNQGFVQFNQQIPMGVDGTFETFVIYDESEQYGLQIDLSPTLPVFNDAFFGAVFYGNFLRKTGRPAHQEIGNPVANARRSSTR